MTNPTEWKKNRETWAKALESGEYKQGSGKLRNRFDQYCCLGVLAELRHVGPRPN